MPDEDATPYEFYSAQYARFGSALAAEVRREAYGEDLGQQGWRTLAEQAAIIDLVDGIKAQRLLDVACGSGGPSLAIAARTSCHVTGVDIEPEGIAQATQSAAAMGLDGRANFLRADCSGSLPFPNGAFDLVVCIDALIHLGDRFAPIAEWARLLRPGGLLVVTDAAVLTGPIAKPEIDTRASQGVFVLVPLGVNECAIKKAGFDLLRCDDTTNEIAQIAARLFAAREVRAVALTDEEGADWFANRQRFLSTTAKLAGEGRLSRFRYVAEKPG